MTCVIVIGCYRTGTSAVAGVLHHLGVSMGKSFDPPAKSNPKGFFEDLDFKNLHPMLERSTEDFKKLCFDIVKDREKNI